MAVRFSTLMDALEPRRLFATATPVGVNFVEESLWDSNFPTAVAQAKALGVSAVRVWFGFDSYDDRPNVWDPKLPFGTLPPGATPAGHPILNPISQTMQRVFDLKRAGFKVMVIMNNDHAAAPDSADQERAFVRHVMDSPETPGGSLKLKDVVDYWEIGNEPDTAAYWAPSAAGKAAGLKSYVDNLLIPAAEELHANGDDENVVAAGVSYSPTDLNAIITELKAQNALGDVDYLGFHPYGYYDPANGVDGVRASTLQAKAYADAVGKKLMATEWNVRGFGNTGANDTKFAAAIDAVYRNTILPNYEASFYYEMVNNWMAFQGPTSAKPGGLLKHDNPPPVSPASTPAQMAAYFSTPLVPAEPFYSTFKAWQYGTVTGTVTSQSPVPAGASLTSTSVYIDLDGDGVFDAGEPAVAPDSTGAYTLTYSSRSVPPGTYSLRVNGGTDFDAAGGPVTLALANLTTRNGVNFSVVPEAAAPPPVTATVGTVSGTVWNDVDGDKTVDPGQSAVGGWTVYLDVNANGLYDSADPSALSGAGGAFTIAYDTAVTGPALVALRVALPDGYTTTTTAPYVVLAGGAALTGQRIGVRGPAVLPPAPPVTTPVTPSPATGSISGFLWNDANADGVYTAGEGFTGLRTVFVDVNKNNKADAGEPQVLSDAGGNFAFTGLTPGTYRVTRVFPAGYHLSNNTLGYVTATVTAGQTTLVYVGTTTKPLAPANPPVVTPPVVTPPVVTPPVVNPPVVNPPVLNPPVVVPPTAGTGSISGKVFAQVSKWNAAALATSWTAFLDANKNGVLDAGEVYAAARSDLTYAFGNLAAGTYTLALKAVAGWKVVTPTTKTFTITLKAGVAKTGQNFVVAKV